MKKRTITFLALMGAVSVFVLAVPLAYAGPVSGEARLLRSEGTVQAKDPESTQWRAVNKGESLKPGTALRTSNGSSCDIGLGEGRKSVIHLKADSQTTLTSLDPANINIDLAQGKVFALVRGQKKESSFKVSTPTAIASVRGTGWEQSLETVQVFENQVDVTGAGGEEMLLEEGKGIQIGSDGDLGELFEVSAEAKEEWNQVEDFAEQSVVEASSQPEGTDTGPGEQGSDADFDSFNEGFDSSGSPDEGFDANDVHEDSAAEVGDQEDIEDELDDGKGGKQDCNVYPYC